MSVEGSLIGTSPKRNLLRIVHKMCKIEGMLHKSCPSNGIFHTISTNEGRDTHRTLRPSMQRGRIMAINVCITSCTLFWPAVKNTINHQSYKLSSQISRLYPFQSRLGHPDQQPPIQNFRDVVDPTRISRVRGTNQRCRSRVLGRVLTRS